MRIFQAFSTWKIINYNTIFPPSIWFYTKSQKILVNIHN